MNDLYSDNCGCTVLPDLADNGQEWDDIYTEIARQLLEGEDLTTDALYNKTATQLVEAMHKGFGGTYDDNDSRTALQDKFKRNIEQFSYAKTLTQFHLFKDALFNDKGQIQSLATVKKAVADTGEVFNNNYLRAEHSFVTQTAIMANKWETLDSEYLEFTTVGDSHVRPEHRKFDKFTALKSDPIWRRLYTPLDWGCRCTVIPGTKKNVSKEFDSDWANKAVDPLVKGTIFDNNAALTGKIFTEKHPYFKVTNSKNRPIASNDFTPEGIKDYEEKTGIKVNKEIFSYLKKETPFYTISPDSVGTKGAFFHPDKNYVVIPIDKIRLNSKWKAESVVYHEFGHAADWQNDLKFKKSVTDLMKKHRSILKLENGYANVDRQVMALGYKYQTEGNWDMTSKCMAVSDTIMSLNSNYGQGHSKAYFKIKGMSEAEFLAHAFENKFAGNDVFKKIMPELYDDTIKLIDELKTKLK
ncbi:phage minor head protein [Flavobacterium sp. UMI-01]|uniref:phage minor head protein n=1 Tax=Flavobacterium sp. UMI-01 TaxID=1441053 RepID=UPI001C7DB8A4|nr:phage minor head protein [Flavobacterium sp. UMI-01]GIZ10272.1 hypothetical protein FUMI01_29960 [Flavobacterium sp. UMI-01]